MTTKNHPHSWKYWFYPKQNKSYSSKRKMFCGRPFEVKVQQWTRFPAISVVVQCSIHYKQRNVPLQTLSNYFVYICSQPHQKQLNDKVCFGKATTKKDIETDNHEKRLLDHRQVLSRGETLQVPHLVNLQTANTTGRDNQNNLSWWIVKRVLYVVKMLVSSKII